MSKLIITLLAIALSAAAAFAGYDYMANTSSDSNTTAQATSVINEANQIKAAAILYYNKNGAAPSSVSQLNTDGYLRSSMTGWTLAPDSSGKYLTAQNSNISTKVCAKVNELFGFSSTTVPSCSNNTNGLPCCAN